MSSKLFTPFRLGGLNLPNRVVLAPMTRNRAINNVPNDLMAQFYAARAQAGLLITEGTSPSLDGTGYIRIPGVHTAPQIKGWKGITDAVHSKGGKIFVQLMHCGRIGHPANLPAGAKLLGPSAIACSDSKIWTDASGMQAFPVPEAMTANEVQRTIAEFANAAKCSIQAGFDGVELHGANGYLLEQFLNPRSNQRTDAYGADRKKFVVEVARATIDAIGADKVGIRLSPYGVFNDMEGAFDGVNQFYLDLTKQLSSLGLVYLHVVDHTSMGAPPLPPQLKVDMRNAFKGAFILSGGYNGEKANADLAANKGDLVSFGRPFIANPNFTELLKNNKESEQKAPNPALFYTPGAEGYTVNITAAL